VIENNKGHYADAADSAAEDAELARIAAGVDRGRSLGLTVNAGHGLHFGNTARIAALPGISELNIGHALVAEALFIGWRRAVADMKALMLVARAEAPDLRHRP
jgi:pyridoxine 5-phosphate synthase